MRVSNIVSGVCAVVVALQFAGCAVGPGICSLSAPRIDNNDPAKFAGTIGRTELRRALPRSVVLDRITSKACGHFDRVVFEFQGDDLPGYKIEYIDKPIRDCGSGAVVPVAGDAWLEVHFSYAQAHTDAGEATIRERERAVRHPNVKELQSTCDFEGEVIWVLGVGSPNRYRVFGLTNPARLVVDVHH